MFLKQVIALTLLIGCFKSVQAQSVSPVVWAPIVQAQPQPAPTIAGYLGSAQNDELVAAQLTFMGHLVLAANLPASVGAPETTLPGGGYGALVRMTGDGRSVHSITRVASSLQHAAWAADGSAVACGPDGITVLEPDFVTVRWHKSIGAISRCSIASNGQIAALRPSDNKLLLYSPTGSAVVTITISGTAAADVVIDSSLGLVFVAGYTQAASDLKVPFLRAHSTSNGNLVWQLYNFTAAAVKAAGLGADSTGNRLALGADGKLYFAGFTDGGNSVFSRDPMNLSRQLTSSELIKFDEYNNPFNISGAKSLAWYARFEPSNGALLLSQWLLSRASNGTGNSISIEGLAAAADGTLIVVGQTYCCIQGRSNMQLFGQTLGNYEAGEPFILLVKPDFSQRLLWTALAAPGATAGSSPAIAASISHDRVAAAVTLSPNSTNSRALVITGNPSSATRIGGKDGYYLLMPRP